MEEEEGEKKTEKGVRPGDKPQQEAKVTHVYADAACLCVSEGDCVNEGLSGKGREGE